MSKVLKIFLNQGFTPVNQEVFRLGTCIEYDCYIQRFNGFAILIEAGTFLDEKMYQKLISSDLNIYVKNSDYSKYKEYANSIKSIKNYILDELSLEDEIENVEKLYKKLPKVSKVEEKLKIIYFVGKNFFQAWLKTKTSKLPKQSLDELSMSLATVVQENSVTLAHFRDIIETRYSLEAHLMNVSFYAAILGSKIFIDMMDLKNVIIAAMLHDVGKCEIDESLLEKPDMLSKEEFEQVKLHSETSVKVSKQSGFINKEILKAVAEHHERLDGSGYPKGLKTNQISDFGKIVALCDVFDAMTTVKPYRGAYSTYNALMIVRKEYSKKLDMRYITLLIKLLH